MLDWMWEEGGTDKLGIFCLNNWICEKFHLLIKTKNVRVLFWAFVFLTQHKKYSLFHLGILFEIKGLSQIMPPFL